MTIVIYIYTMPQQDPNNPNNTSTSSSNNKDTSSSNNESEITSKTNQLRSEFDKLTDRLDDLTYEVQSDEDEGSDLSTQLHDLEDKKIAIYDSYQVLIDKSRDDSDKNMEETLELERLTKEIANIRRVVDILEEEAQWSHSRWASSLSDDLKKQEEEVKALNEELNPSVLKEANSSEDSDSNSSSSSSSGQNSLLDDFADLSTEPADYTGGDD